MKRIPIALIGAGSIGRSHVDRSLKQPGVDLIVIAIRRKTDDAPPPTATPAANEASQESAVSIGDIKVSRSEVQFSDF